MSAAVERGGDEPSMGREEVRESAWDSCGAHISDIVALSKRKGSNVVRRGLDSMVLVSE